MTVNTFYGNGRRYTSSRGSRLGLVAAEKGNVLIAETIERIGCGTKSLICAVEEIPSFIDEGNAYVTELRRDLRSRLEHIGFRY